MLEVAWTNAEAENFAAQAFKIALETDNWLIVNRGVAPTSREACIKR